jgi:hypothetical protein
MSHAASEELLEKRPETYGWTRKHLILQPLVKNLLVIHQVPGHGSLEIVEEVRYKDTQVPTFVLEHLPSSARRIQAKAVLEYIQEEAKHLRSFVCLHIVTVIGSYGVRGKVDQHAHFPLKSPVGENDSRNFLDIVGDQVKEHQHSK